MKKAVFFDIDGTLWDFKMNIPESTKKALKELRKNGYYAFLCSGRSRSNIKSPKLLALGFDGIVAASGTHIEFEGEKLFELLLTKEQIEIQRYRSVPLFGIKNMVQKLLESGQTVKGVPGFYEDQDGKWTINFTSKNSGILIPIRSMEGKIQGFQIRLDQVMEGRKYIWLSSVKFQNGVSSGSPVHVIGSLDAEQIYFTEGALKGTIAHYLSGDTFICVAGVNQYRNLKPVLETLKSRHLQHLYEAYDMDKKMKVYCDGDSEKCDACQRKPATFYCPHKMQKRQILQNACRKVYEICSGLSISMSRMVWDMDSYGEWNGQIKGIDDYYYVLKNTG